MEIFDLFRSKLDTDNQQRKTKDERKAECPYCFKLLKKIPSAKTKCPHCGQFIFVRTRLQDKARVVTTKEGAEQIDLEWKHQEILATKIRMKRFEEDSLVGLKSWKDSGVVEAVKCINSGRDTICRFCRTQEGKIVSFAEAKVGINIPPFYSCENFETTGCCCGFKPILKQK